MTSTRKYAPEIDLASLAEENKALLQQHQTLRNMLEKAQSENSRFKQRIEQLSEALRVRDKQLSDSQQFEHGFKRSKENAKDLELKVLKEQQAALVLQEEKKQIEASIAAYQQKIKQLESVIQFLRSKAETAHLETKQLQEDFQKTHSDMASFSQQCQEKEERIAALQIELESEKNAHAENAAELLTIQQQWKQLQDNILASQNQIGQLNEEMNHQRKLYEDNIRISNATLEEKDQEIKAAQQHLARKLKELSLLGEKQEDQQRFIAELQKVSNEAKAKNAELQTTFQAQLDQEKRLRELLQDSSKTTEAQIKKWEEKYFQIYDRWQEAESRNRDLRLLEEKYVQMQALLSNLGALAGAPVSSNKPTEVPNRPSPIEQAPNHEKSSQQKSVSEDPNLFDAPKTNTRHRQSFFE